MKRRLVWLVLLVATFGAVAALRRRSGAGKERVDLYYEDGSMISLPGDSPSAALLLPLAEELLAAASRTA